MSFGADERSHYHYVVLEIEEVLQQGSAATTSCTCSTSRTYEHQFMEMRDDQKR